MKFQLFYNILLIFLSLDIIAGLLWLISRRRGKKVKTRRLFLYAGGLLTVYLLGGVFIAYLQQPEISQDYVLRWSSADFYGEKAADERVALVKTNQGALEERLRLISLAQERIILSSFDLRADNSGCDVIAMLLEAADRGVQIEMMVDGFNAMLNMDGEKNIQNLAAHENVNIYIYNPVNVLKPWELMGRLHDKYIIVDNSYLLLGGRNTNDFFLGDYPGCSRYSLDMEVLVYGGGEALRQVESYFDGIIDLPCTKSFRGERCRPEVEESLFARAEELRTIYPQCFLPYDYEKNTYSASKITLLSNPPHTGAKEPQVLWAMTQLLSEAREQAVIYTPYLICNDAMYERISLVAQNVPDTRMILNSCETASNIFGAAVYQNDKRKIIETGADTYTYFCQSPASSCHMKTALVDTRLSLIGSFNFDMRSAYLNTELMLAVDSPELAVELEAYLEEIQASSGRIVDMESMEVPEGLLVPDVPPAQRLSRLFLRIIERPIRFLM